MAGKLRIDRIPLPLDHMETLSKLPKLIGRVCLKVICLVSWLGGSHEVQISGKAFKKHCGNRYKEGLDKLLELGLIWTDNHYVVGGGSSESKCKTYRLLTEFEKWQWQKLPKGFDFEVHEVLEVEDDKTTEDCSIEITPEHEIVAICKMRMQRFEILEDLALDHLELRQRGMVINKNGKVKPIMKPMAYRTARKAVIAINSRQHYVKMDRFGRIHTNYTSMSKWVRNNCLRHCKGGDLVQLDIVSSQVNLLRRVLMQELDMNHPKIAKEMEIFTSFCNTDFYVCLYFLHCSFIYDKDPLERPTLEQRLRIEVSHKDFPDETIRPDFKMEGIKILFDPSSRGLNVEVKKKNGKVEFSSKQSFGLYKTFRILFPNVYAKIKELKKEDYRALAHRLQSEEAKILHRLILELEVKNIDFLSIHDCLIVQKQHQQEVHEIFIGILQDAKVLPNIDISSIPDPKH